MIRRATIVLLAATCLAGCAKSPTATVAVANVAIASTTDEGAVLAFELQLSSTSGEPLTLKEIRYTLSMDGQIIFDGIRYAETTVSEVLPQTVSIPAPVARELVDWPLTGVRPYRISGTVAFLRPGPIGEMLYDMGLKRKSVRFGESGGLDFGASGADVQLEDQTADSASESSNSTSSDSSPADEP